MEPTARLRAPVRRGRLRHAGCAAVSAAASIAKPRPDLPECRVVVRLVICASSATKSLSMPFSMATVMMVIVLGSTVGPAEDRVARARAVAHDHGSPWPGPGIPLTKHCTSRSRSCRRRCRWRWWSSPCSGTTTAPPRAVGAAGSRPGRLHSSSGRGACELVDKVRVVRGAERHHVRGPAPRATLAVSRLSRFWPYGW